MSHPEFPQGFLKHCPKVAFAKRFYNYDNPEDAAECAFVNCGFGMKCENCELHLTRPFLNHDIDREFLPQIEQYYRDVVQYEKELKLAKKMEEMHIGEGI